LSLQSGTCQALLVLADISGFTKFMKLHAITVTHAKQIIGFFRSFYQEMLKLCELQLCLCEACVSVKASRLKIVLHAGEVAVERIHSFEKLFGIEVIVAHRLLKNSVPAKEYVLRGKFLHLPQKQIGE